MIEQHYQTTKPRSLLQKRRLEIYLELLRRIMGLPLLKYANFSTIVKCRFYGLKRLFLTKQHHQTRKPRSLLKRRRLERYLKILTRIMGWFDFVLFSFQGPKSSTMRGLLALRWNIGPGGYKCLLLKKKKTWSF